MRTSEPPTGEVTLMFTDIEGSTRNWDTYQEQFHPVLERHNALLRLAIAEHTGYEVKTIRDSFMVAFASPAAAASCALQMQQAIEGEIFPGIGTLRVRIGLHLGELTPYEGDYFGPVVNRTARIESAAHGEQEFPLEPLSAPPAGTPPELCRAFPSVQLFEERARAVRPAFELNAENLSAVGEICRRLDGLPLAIELTAALVRGLTAQQILPRLQDRFKFLASTRRDL